MSTGVTLPITFALHSLQHAYQNLDRQPDFLRHMRKLQG